MKKKVEVKKGRNLIRESIKYAKKNQNEIDTCSSCLSPIDIIQNLIKKDHCSKTIANPWSYIFLKGWGICTKKNIRRDDTTKANCCDEIRCHPFRK
jgi:hypothetical protein